MPVRNAVRVERRDNPAARGDHVPGFEFGREGSGRSEEERERRGEEEEEMTYAQTDDPRSIISACM